MKIRKSLKIAQLICLNIALLVGTVAPALPAVAAAASTPQQIYSWPTIQSKTAADPAIITKGVTYQKITYKTDSGPITVHETWIDLREPNVAVKPVLSHDKLQSEKNETLHQMSGRTGAVAGVNADYFESAASGMALNMTVYEGDLLHHPTSSAVLGIDANKRVTIDKYQFTSAVQAANGQSYEIKALNGHPVSYKESMVLLTPELGYWEMASSATVVTLQRLAEQGRYKVIGIEAAKNVVEAPYVNTVKLLAQGSTAIAFVTANMQKGDEVALTYGTSPSTDHLRYAIGGGPILIKDGESYRDPNPPAPINNTRRDPLTGVGVTQDGNKMLQLVIDGRSDESIGVTVPQMANYMAYRGLHNAMLFDGGGSSEMVVRQPGTTKASIANQPSDGWERRIPNGLMVFSTMPSGRPTHVTVNNGQGVKVFMGESTKVSGYVRDEYYNPLSNEKLTYAVEPATLGTISTNGTFQAAATGGKGRIIAKTASGVQGEIPVTVFNTVESLSISPSIIDIGEGETQSFTVQGKVEGQTITLKPEYLTWSTGDASLGTITSSGLFTAGDKRGTANVTAKLGTVSVKASVGIGYVQKTLDDLSGGNKWVRTQRWGDVGTISTSSAQVRGGKSASLAINYKFPAGTGMKQFVFYPEQTLPIPLPTDNAAVNPIGVGVWIYGDNSGLKMIASFEKPNGTFIQATNSVNVNWQGWKYVTFKLPSTATFPLKLDYFDLLVENPSSNINGTVYLSDLQVLYAARTYQEKAVTPPPTPQPDPPVQVVTFPDISTHWGRQYIEKLATKQIIFGLDESTFAPDKQLDRAQAVALLVRALNLPVEKTSVFSDVPSDAWYAGAVGAAVKAGIVSGVGEGKFAPTAPVDRNQAATMIYNALNVYGKAPTGGTPVTFKDADDIASWAKDKVGALAAAKVMVGDEQGYFKPKQIATRAQAAVMIHNMMDYAGLLK